ncbi:hypothetical protein QO010_000124 [Caulobacter ginsengisoli]|uniref:DUF4893 domain-containing protein n=1 Tax=Caulobacter ginsengisoli TaxID=400775 RepID=A0ABU0ILX2_9CAUL|nr:hypothetical protein [Caulobacter ginsengisoli]MDQ0462376.1 hypothetical protein [Caulobacter ginsengisoli]
MRSIAMIAAVMSLAACQPAAGPRPKDPPPPLTAETQAELERQIQGANALDADLRGKVGLPAEPAGDTVIRIVQGSFMNRSQESLVAARTSAGWRLEWVDGKFATDSDKATPARLRVIAVPPADGQRLDALLADPALFRQSTYETRPGCMDGGAAVIDIRTPTARWTGYRQCGGDPPVSKVTDILFELRPPE